MKRTGLIRLGGLVAMVGGVANVMLGLVVLLCTPSCPRSLVYVLPAFFVLLAFGAMAAIATLHLLQRQHYGLLGTLAFLVAFVGVAMIFVGELRSLVIGMSQDSSGAAAASWLFIIGLLVATIGLPAYGAVTITAGELPWWCGAALMAGSPLVGMFLYLFFDFDFLLGLPWAVLGFAIFRAGSRLSEQPSRVR